MSTRTTPDGTLEGAAKLEAFHARVEASVRTAQALIKEKAWEKAVGTLKPIVHGSGLYEENYTPAKIVAAVGAIRMLAVVQAEQGHLEASKATLRRLIEVLVDLDPSSSSQVSIPRLDLGMLLLKEGQVESGVEVLGSLLEATGEAKEPFEQQMHLGILSSAASLLMGAQRFSEASPFVHRALYLSQSLHGKTSQAFADALTQLAEVKRAEGDTERAQELFESAFEILAAQPEPSSRPRCAKIAHIFFEFHAAQNSWRMAASWLSETISQWERAQTGGLEVPDLAPLQSRLRELKG